MDNNLLIKSTSIRNPRGVIPRDNRIHRYVKFLSSNQDSISNEIISFWSNMIFPLGKFNIFETTTSFVNC